MSSIVTDQNDSSLAPEPSGKTVRQITIEAGKYLGRNAGELIPTQEVRVQAKANGYSPDEITQLLVDAGLGQASAVTVPEQGDLLGKLWRTESERADNTGLSAKNESDTDDWTGRHITGDGGCSPEPLDDGVSDCYALYEPITTNPDLVDKNRYLRDDGQPMTHFDTVGSYIEQRHSEGTTAKRYGWTKGRQYYAKQQYRRGMGADRQLLAEYENPTTVLLSLRMSPPNAGRLTMLTVLKTAADATITQLRYRLQNAPDASCEPNEWEYMAVFAGTEQRATPHLHIYVWVDGDVSQARFEPVVEKYVKTCEFAPDDGRGNRLGDGTVCVRGNGDDDVPRVDDEVLDPTNCEYAGENSPGGVYALTQLPHLRDVDEMARDELLHSATIDAWGGQAFRTSVSESKIKDEFLADNPVSSADGKYM